MQGNVHNDSDGNPKKILGTVTDITAFKQLQQEKDDFISIASHELKTPLTSLKVSLQLLDRMKTSSTTIMPRLIDQCNRSMEKISELVEDLLNVTRINEGKMMLNIKKFNLAHLVEECCLHLGQAGNHELVIEGNKNIEIVADENRIEQVVINFITNAVKYAPKSRQIYLTTEHLGDSVKLSVRDTGPGIPANKLPRLFERYYRVDQSGVRFPDWD